MAYKDLKLICFSLTNIATLDPTYHTKQREVTSDSAFKPIYSKKYFEIPYMRFHIVAEEVAILGIHHPITQLVHHKLAVASKPMVPFLSQNTFKGTLHEKVQRT